MFLLLFIGTMAISLFAMARVKSAMAKYSQVPAASGLSGAEAARRILHMAGIDHVDVVSHDGMMGDHYDPIHKRLVLSRENFAGRSIAAAKIDSTC